MRCDLSFKRFHKAFNCQPNLLRSSVTLLFYSIIQQSQNNHKLPSFLHTVYCIHICPSGSQVSVIIRMKVHLLLDPGYVFWNIRIHTG
jgi:hypothetical protein